MQNQLETLTAKRLRTVSNGSAGLFVISFLVGISLPFSPPLWFGCVMAGTLVIALIAGIARLAHALFAPRWLQFHLLTVLLIMLVGNGLVSVYIWLWRPDRSWVLIDILVAITVLAAVAIISESIIRRRVSAQSGSAQL